MCFSPDIGTCLIPEQVPRCVVSCLVYVIDPFLFLLLSSLLSNPSYLSFQLPHTCQGPIGSKEWDNKEHWSPWKQAWAALFGLPVCWGCSCWYKTSSAVGFVKTRLRAALELGVGVLCVVWRAGVGSARDAAGAVSEPRAQFGSSLLVLQHKFGGINLA